MPQMIVKRFGFTAIHNKLLNKCLIHSFNSIKISTHHDTMNFITVCLDKCHLFTSSAVDNIVIGLSGLNEEHGVY